YFSTKEASKTIVKYGKTTALEIGFEGDNAMVTEHSVDISNLQPATFYYAKAYAIDANSDTSSSAIQLFSTASLSRGKMDVYFNSTVEKTVADGKEAIYLNKTIDDSLVAYIGRAKNALDIAVYSFDNANLSANISDALNAAYNRGVKIRFITDAENKNNGLNNLNSGIPVLRSPTPSFTFKLMHNKFVIRDVADADPNVPSVWTGSTNWTDNQIHGDPNHLVVIQDQALAKAYLLEFEEMWGSSTMTPNQTVSRFGPMKTDNIPHNFMIGGKMVELYFSPSDKTNGKIIDALNTANKEMYFSTMLITRTDIANTIKNKANEGVFVAGILGDTLDASSRTAYHIMEPALGNNLRVYQGSGIFHHKYAIVDAQVFNSDPQVITGSHNWSSSAENNNDENTLIIHDSTVANLFYQEWLKRYMESGGTDTFKYIKPVSIETKDKRPADYSLQGYLWKDQTLNLKIESKTFGKSQIVLRDLNGKLIALTNANLQNGETLVNLPSAPVAHGIYLLTIYQNGQARSYKLAKF
ncbi:MAG: phospholipase D-like domain-containing protein, partial [Bacteroidia bacterium]